MLVLLSFGYTSKLQLGTEVLMRSVADIEASAQRCPRAVLAHVSIGHC